ncbi:MAG TPA: NAD(P)/FAD-dependent oxidoreductase [Puia sp.]|nr:NAD(P)/FAD-dependent oxidoreductase [Puia sp.]
MPRTLIVIGGGAAGFFCAVNAARMNPDLKVTILEKSSKLLSKVKVSGGGRCNVTHACFEIEEMMKKYPRGQHFVKKAFHQFFTKDIITWFEERNVMLKKEEDGRMFPITDSSDTIIECLIKEANKYRIEILINREVKEIKKINSDWQIRTLNAELLTANYLCIASGGYPKSSMFDWLKNIGHSIEEPVPSLFTFNLPNNSITKLMGVSVANARVKIVGSKLSEQGPVLITHWGLSGPAVLRLSAWGARELSVRSYEFGVVISWLPEYAEQALREKFSDLRSENASQKISGKNYFGLPQRLWEYLIQQSGITENMRWADLPGKLQNVLIQNLIAQQFEVKGKTTFKEEFVTAGGIKLSEIDPNTMQSKIVPDLFFAGEVMDVDGITGGFNFQHAWTSGFVAAKSIVSRNEATHTTIATRS